MSLDLCKDISHFTGRIQPIVTIDLPQHGKPITVDSLRKIVHPILNSPSAAVTWPINDEAKQTIADLLATAKKLNDVAGLAAPQIGKNLQIFIHQISDEGNQSDLFSVIINPKILEQSTEVEEAYEGCFSVPGYKGLVPRHKTITIEYFNEAGERITKKISNPFLARVFQHEGGHLAGEMYYQKMKPTDQLLTRTVNS